MADTFTYEDIYELLRSEKFSSELEEIKQEDLSKINNYLKVKENLVNKEETTSMMSSARRVKLLTEIENAKRTLSDLYEKRERKIINRAIVTIRSGKTIRDTSNMLDFEIELYKNIMDTLESNKNKFFDTIYSAQATAIPTPDPEPKEQESESEPEKTEEQPETLATPKEPKVKEESTEELSLTQEAAKESTPTQEENSEIKKIDVELLENSENFYAEDLKTYGPFSTGEQASLPEKIAKLLIEQKKVKLIKNESSKKD